MKFKSNYLIIILLLLIFGGLLFHFRIDLTSEKKFSISSQSKALMQNLNAPLHIILYLDGDLNPGFQRLKNAAVNMIDELKIAANQDISIEIVNPTDQSDSPESKALMEQLLKSGITPTAIYERDKQGKSIQKIVYPWISVQCGKKTVSRNLLKKVRGLSGDENLNISIENLEFEITDAIRSANTHAITKIAFIEGHGELNEAQTYDISKSLSKYFQIDRGVIATDASVLKPYKAIIFASPTQSFSESDKFIIDQYVMQGGAVLWLVDGVRVSAQSLSKSGFSPAMALDLNLSDMFFRYGVRINSTLLQDVQCVQIPVNIAPAGSEPQFEPSPWFFAPLLLTSYQHPITKNITEVRSEFASTIESVGENKRTKTTVLLATSDNSHQITTPATIDLAAMPQVDDKLYFNQQYLPVAVLIEGNFNSAFANRIPPPGLSGISQVLSESRFAKQIFVANGQIIRNETTGIPGDSTTLPLGFDRYMNMQFGNKDFLLNSLLYLTQDANWLELRTRTLKLRLLNKKILTDKLFVWQIIGISIPLLVLLLFGIVRFYFRRQKYTSVK
jgi:ABC-2 type transport system permease protein